jgi:hypothetical protein
MNLNKYTKAELISKIKNNKSDINKKITIIELLLKLKTLILSFTIIALLIKYFKKYTFFSKILRFTN